MTRPLCTLILLALVACSPSRPQLNVFIWSEYLDPAVIREFEQQHNCRVVLDYYEDPESMIAKLAAGGDSLYDIVVPSNNNLPVLVNRGLLAPLPRDGLPNLQNLDPAFTNTLFDPGNRHGAPYQWGTTGLYVRAPTNQSLDESWSLIFRPDPAVRRFLLIDDPRSCIGAALRFRGVNPNTADPKHLADARELLAAAKHRSLGFEGSVGGRNRVLSKDAEIAIVYSVDAIRGVEEDPDTRYLIPREGSELWLDCMSIPARAPHPELAARFINFLLEAKVAARTAEYNRAATPNRAARDFLNASSLNNPAIYPPAETMSRLEYSHDLGPTNRLYEDLWTQLKAR